MSANEYVTHRYYQHNEVGKLDIYQTLRKMGKIPKLDGGGHIEHHAETYDDMSLKTDNPVWMASAPGTCACSAFRLSSLHFGSWAGPFQPRSRSGCRPWQCTGLFGTHSTRTCTGFRTFLPRRACPPPGLLVCAALRSSNTFASTTSATTLRAARSTTMCVARAWITSLAHTCLWRSGCRPWQSRAYLERTPPEHARASGRSCQGGPALLLACWSAKSRKWRARWPAAPCECRCGHTTRRAQQDTTDPLSLVARHEPQNVCRVCRVSTLLQMKAGRR